MISLLVTFGLLFVGIILVAYGTVVKNNWGINLDPVACPRCRTQLPQYENRILPDNPCGAVGRARHVEQNSISGDVNWRL